MRISRKCIKIFFTLLAVLILSLTVYALDEYFPTNRDTRLPPLHAEILSFKTDEYELLGQFGNLAYYYRSDRNIILAENTLNGYTWKTGLDAPFSQDLDRAIDAAQTLNEKIKAAQPREVRLNATYIGLANSLLTVDFYDDAFNMNIVSSAARQGARSHLVKINEGHFRLDANFTNIDLTIRLHIHLTDRGINYKIYDHEIEGDGAARMASIIITPFLGAAGGVRQYFNPETGEYGEEVSVPMTPGYAFVPDGSGALIRYNDNTVSINRYTGKVYGSNPAETMFYYDNTVYAVKKKEPIMPVFGAAIGNNQQGFVAWADDGGENMEIVMSPKGNMTNYNYIYPRFVFNRQMHQVYNRKGEGYFRLYPDRLHYDISIEYRFLEDEKANYAGMAHVYRNHLIENGTLIPDKVRQDGVIPLRADFIMSDVKKSIIGHSNVVTTNAEDVINIIRNILDNGIGSVNGGLLGFQNGGITAGKPWTLNFIRSIGTKSDFRKLFSEAISLNVDISFAQNYSVINSIQMNLPRNQAYHRNRWGIRALDNLDFFLPVQEISFARPQRSAEWFIRQAKISAIIGSPSITADGITNRLISHWGRSDPITTSGAIELYENTFASSPLPINAKTPNQYLWKYTERFLETPVLSTQYILQTDTVPFLQMVLNGTMEMYAPYSNFSFYTQRDILRMIDYNVYPSFALTQQPAYLLSSTNSLKYFSTEYNVYKDIIKNVYTQVSSVLSSVKGRQWLNRTVLAEGIVLNEYSDDINIIINYTDNAYLFENVSVNAQSAVVCIDGERL
ncbi:MAG: DUF5696 domain-containing protein [Treponema sp.]|nr:DUF5696 domain-containing protein [Treponema sp.]